MQIGECGHLMLHHRFGVREIGPVIAFVELDQQLARFDVLVVADEDFRNKAGDMRRQGRDVTADIGVVGGFDKAADFPPVPAVPGNAAGSEQAEYGDANPPAQAKAAPGRRDAVRWARRKSAIRAAVEDFGGHASLAPPKGRCPRSDNFRRTASSAPGPGASEKSGPASLSPVAPSTNVGSTTAPVRLLMICTGGPSGAKWRLPQASNASSTG